MLFFVNGILPMQLVVEDGKSGFNYFDDLILLSEPSLVLIPDKNRYHISAERYLYWTGICCQLNMIEQRILEIKEEFETQALILNSNPLEDIKELDNALFEVSKLSNIEEHIQNANLLLETYHDKRTNNEGETKEIFSRS